ncbi:sensor histidine kinase [Pseudoxanthomonas sp. LjRoot143]|uniref:sensor histidine kinase n=1 Tax=Pseudoxanthomonas sp. LjRoot143 TaxID=3342266 RepID=UPI003F50D215
MDTLLSGREGCVSSLIAIARRWATLSWLTCCVLLARTEPAIATPFGMAEYHRSTWSQRDGAPPDIWALAQDPGGALWLGTGIGLYRFDGIGFERYNAPQGNGFASSNITALLTDSRGRLWIGFYPGGISVLEAGRLKHYPPSPVLPTGLVMRITEDAAGHIWVPSFTGLYRFDGKRWARVGPEMGFPYRYADDVLLDSKGTLWVAAGDTLLKLPSGASRFEPTHVATGAYTSLLEAPDGTLWISDGTYGTRSMPSAPKAFGFGHFASMSLDRSGALWGTDRRRGGLARIAGLDRLPAGYALGESDVAETIQRRNGLASDRAVPVLTDREGNVWVGTNMGLHRFRPSSMQVLQDERLSQSGVYGMAFSPSHGLLVSSGRQLYRVDDNDLTLLASSVGRGIYAIHAAGPRTYVFAWDGAYEYSAKGLLTLDMPGTGTLGAVACDGTGGFLVMREGQGLFQYDGKTWTGIGTGVIPPHGATSLLRDPDGSVWIGYNGSRIVHWRSGEARIFGSKEGLDIGTVSALENVGEGVLAGGESGVVLLRDGQVRPLRSADRNRLSGITGLHRRPGGDLWMNGVNGVFHVPVEELGKGLERGSLDGRLYDTADGMPGIAQQSTLMSTIVTDGAGRLWFSTNQGLAMIDPAKPFHNPVVPTVSIRGLAVGEIEYGRVDGKELQAGTRDMRIRYAASSLAYPERVRFRYRLEGLDADWQEAGHRRVAYYTNLGPGKYVFRVQAANESGVWSAGNASMAFSIAPRFTQTGWFFGLCATAAAALMYFIHKLRLRRISRRMRMRFEERHRERERIARELHDTLLQSFHGLLLRFQAVANLLAREDPVRASLEQVMDRGEQAIVEGRERVQSLRLAEASVPEDLPQAFASIGRELNHEDAVDFNVVSEGELPPLEAVMRDEIYWIGREALSNAFQHSEAGRIGVAVSVANGNIRFRFRDDGRGVTEDVLRSGGRDGHWGLRGMRERAIDIGAELRISSGPGGGTDVELLVPSRSTSRKRP